MTRRCFAVVLTLATVACTHVADPRSEEEKAIYAMGVQLYRKQVAQLRLNPREIEILKMGLADAASGARLVADPEASQPEIDKRLRRLAGEDAGQEKLRGLAFLTQAALEPGAIKTGSGLVFRTLKPGSGRSPTAKDVVKVHYKGTLINGTVFDSSYERAQPLEFALDQVIPCWTEGVQRMKVGEKARLVCPTDLAYGDRGAPPAIPGGATLVFEVELLDVKKK